MKPRVRNLLAAAILLASGGLRIGLESAVTERYRAEGLLSPPIETGVKEKIGQTSWAVTLSGLRTLVASFTHLRAYDQFAGQRWGDLGKTFDTTVQLAPQTRYYWEIGAWHMAFNAASYYWYDSSLDPSRAHAERMRWIHRGRDFLERGVRNNPRNPLLHLALARLYESKFQFPDDKAATARYEALLRMGFQRTSVRRAWFLSLVRSKGDPVLIRSLHHELMQARENSGLPTMMCVTLALAWQDGTPDDPLALAESIFGTEERALRMLGPYFTDTYERWPLDGVEITLRLLEARSGISADSPASNIFMREKALMETRQ